MRNRFKVLVLGLIAISPGMFAQTATRPGAAATEPDLSGVWLRAGGGNSFDLPLDAAPMQPWAAAKFNTEGTDTGPT